MSGWFIAMLACAVIGGLIGLKLKLPAGAMVGAMIGVAIFTVITDRQVTPKWFKIAAQMVSGGYIGTTMTREGLSQMKKLAKAAAVLLAGMLIVNLLTAAMLYVTSPLDLCTALFATAPGGLTDMTIISDDMGADSPVVSVFQVCRMSAAILLFPQIIPRLVKVSATGERAPKAKKKSAPMTGERYIALFKTLAVAFVSGMLGYLSGISGGTMTFAVIGVAFSKIRFGVGFIPLNVKRGAQMLSGAFIGAKITITTIRMIISMWYNVLIALLVIIPACLAVGYFLLHKLMKIDLLPALFCSAPAGASDMALIAGDLGAEGPEVAVLQIIRLLGVIAIFPTVFKVLLSVVGWNP